MEQSRTGVTAAHFALFVLVTTTVGTVVITSLALFVAFSRTGDHALYMPGVLGAALLRTFVLFGCISVAILLAAQKIASVPLLLIAAAVGAFVDIHIGTTEILFGELARVEPREPTMLRFVARYLFLLVMGWVALSIAKKTQELPSAGTRRN